MWPILSFGVILGLTAGLSPGPLLAVVITQTLQHGSSEGIKVAFAPVLTDLPIIGFAFLLFYSLPELDSALALLSFVGAGFIMLLGIKSLRTESPEYEITQDPPRSYVKGALVNALSPHPYLFWFSVGVPTIIKAAQDSIGLSLLFVSSFFGCLIGTKVVIAMLVGKSRGFLSGPVYLWIMRVLGLCLIGFSLVLVNDGLVLTGVLQGS